MERGALLVNRPQCRVNQSKPVERKDPRIRLVPPCNRFSLALASRQEIRLADGLQQEKVDTGAKALHAPGRIAMADVNRENSEFTLRQHFPGTGLHSGNLRGAEP